MFEEIWRKYGDSQRIFNILGGFHCRGHGILLIFYWYFTDFYWFYWFPPGSGTRGLGVLPVCEPMSQSEESGEPRHSKLPFGWGELKSGRNSRTSGISDFESLHPTKKNFDGRGSAGNRFFGVVRFGGFRPGREIPSPAGEISEQILEIRGGFPRFSKKKTFLRKL